MKLSNLLPKTERTELKLQFFSKQLLLFWVWILMSILIVYILTWVARYSLLRQEASIETQIVQKEEILKSSDNEKLKQQVSLLNDQIGSINNLTKQHYFWSEGLAELGNLLAPNIHLNTLTLDRATGKVDMQGTADSRESVLNFWSDIHKSPFFKNINFPLSNLERANNDSFSFTFYINPERIKQE